MMDDEQTEVLKGISAGIGIRFVTPAFPIRLDWGYGFNHRPGEQNYQINFGIGSLF